MPDVGAALQGDGWVHVALHAAGTDPGPAKDGGFERSVLMRFQIEHGLRPSGAVDDATLRLLRNELADDYIGTMSTGARGRQVETLQRALTLLGLPVDVDGIYGPRTVDAVLQFQGGDNVVKAGGPDLDADGIVGPRTWGAITGLDPNRLAELDRKGARGEHVRWVQRALLAADFAPGPIDGVFGEQTAEAVRGLQHDAGIDVDGIVGPDTRRVLRRRAARHLGDGYERVVLQVAFVEGVPRAYVRREGRDAVVAVDLGGDGEEEIPTPDPSEPIVDCEVPFGNQSLLMLAGASSSLWSYGPDGSTRVLTTNQWGRPAHIAAAQLHGDLAYVVNDPDGGAGGMGLVDPPTLVHAKDPALFHHREQWRVAWLDEDGLLRRAGGDLDEKSAPPISGADGRFEALRIGGTPDDAFLITQAKGTGLIERWDAVTGEEIPGDQPDGSDAVAFAAARSLIAVAAEDGTVRFHARRGAEQPRPPTLMPGSQIVRLAVAQHGGSVAVAAIDGNGALFGWMQPAAVSTGRTQFVQDQPAREDLLGRRHIAEEMADLMRRMAADDDGADAFAIHLDGKWGSGKSSVVGFVADDLRDGAEPWVVVEMDAWRSSQMSPAWWALLTHLRQAVRGSKGWAGQIGFALGLWWWEVRRSWRLWAPGLAVFGLLGVLWVLNADVSGLFARWSALVATVGAFGLLGSRFLSLGTLQGARLHERTNENPMADVVDQIIWVRSKCKRPILLVLDDLDRCSERFTVEVLDAVQTLIRSPVVDLAEDNTRTEIPVLVVLAVGDQRWLRAAYEDSYQVFKDFVSEEGRPLGHLFLNKLFQVRVELPALGGDQYAAYLNGLLGGDGRVALEAATTDAVDAAVAAHEVPPDPNDDAVSYDRSIAAINSDATRTLEERDELLGLALEMRRRDAAREEREQHLLERYAGLLDPNPRSAKHFVMAYNMAFAARVSEPGDPIDPDTLALWTVLSIRWPELTDWIRGELPYLELAVKQDADGWHPSKLLEKRAVIDVLASDKGGPLDEHRIARCCGVLLVPDPVRNVENTAD